MERPDISKIKDKKVLEYINHLEGQLKTPFADSYMAIKRMVDKGNIQLLKNEIDIFDPENAKKSKMIDDFLGNLEGYFKQMAYFKSKMDPTEVEISDKIVTKDGGVEDYLKSKGEI